MEFKLPPATNASTLRMRENWIPLNDHTTTFESSLQIINLLNADKVILVNGDSFGDYETYTRAILEQRGRTLAVRE